MVKLCFAQNDSDTTIYHLSAVDVEPTLVGDLSLFLKSLPLSHICDNDVCNGERLEKIIFIFVVEKNNEITKISAEVECDGCRRQHLKNGGTNRFIQKNVILGTWENKRSAC